MKDTRGDLFIRFWGVRGSIPTPGREFLKYGGNTPCIEVRCGDTILIFDAGTGLKNLGRSLVDEFGDKPASVHLLITHTHWDHIQGFPFFSYVYMKEKEIHVYGGHYFHDIKDLLAGQMKREYFPVILEEVSSNLVFHELYDNPLTIGDIEIYHTHLMHPALSLGFRLEYRGKVFVYATDNELIVNKEIPEFNLENIQGLIRGADILVAECQYTDREYPNKAGWGHSTIEGVVRLARNSEVKKLYTFHHDPYHDDSFIDKMISSVKKSSKPHLEVIGAREGMVVTI